MRNYRCERRAGITDRSRKEAGEGKKITGNRNNRIIAFVIERSKQRRRDRQPRSDNVVARRLGDTAQRKIVMHHSVTYLYRCVMRTKVQGTRGTRERDRERETESASWLIASRLRLNLSPGCNAHGKFRGFNKRLLATKLLVARTGVARMRARERKFSSVRDRAGCIHAEMLRHTAYTPVSF